MLIWRGPAVMLAVLGGIIGFLIGALIVSLFNIHDYSGNVLIASMGAGIFGLDVGYRKKNGIELADVEVSSFFFVIPTWLVGLIIFFVTLFL